MRILITGGCGYVGTLLVAELLRKGHAVVVVDTMWFGNYLAPDPNLTVIREDVRHAERIDMKSVETVIHLANIANDPCADLDPRISWEVNVLASMRLVERAIRDGVKRFIYASSGSVYGVKDEAEVTEELSLVPISDYNKTKMVSERVLLSYRDSIIVHCIRPATVCGYSPRMRLDLSVNMLTMQALSRGRITVFGGNQTRPNIHIRDLIGVYLHFLNHDSFEPGMYNAGFENMSILEIAGAVARLVPAEIEVTESNDPRSYRLSSKKLLATGFQPRFTVRDAIQEIAEVYRNGKLSDSADCYNLSVMKSMDLH